MATSTVTLAIEHSNPLVALFCDTGVRIAGDVRRPLFCAADVAKKINDQNYRHVLSSYPERYKRIASVADARDCTHDMLMLTEQGLYRYLLRSKRPAAEEFQEWVFGVLTSMREQLVDEARLATKIAQDATKLAQDKYLLCLIGNGDLERENEKLRRALAGRGYVRLRDSTWQDYYQYCLDRYEAEGGLIDREEGADEEHVKALQELRVLVKYSFQLKDYEAGYDLALRRLADEEARQAENAQD
jgi:prophage antirepressor-like protein